MTKHTQWKVVTSEGDDVVLSCRKDHADKIVRCVNTHDSLLAALKDSIIALKKSAPVDQNSVIPHNNHAEALRNAVSVVERNK